MKIDYPAEDQLPALQALWQEAFGDEDAFINLFFDQVFSPDRCRCVMVGGQIAAALYWLDCRADDRPVAYLYAVATAEDYQGQGLCRAMMADTHELLRELGYVGSLLVPGEESLFEMYSTMGYDACVPIREFTCRAEPGNLPIHPITPEEYFTRRKAFLPEGSVLQEGENIAFLSALSRFYAGEDFLLCAGVEDGRLFGAELLGNTQSAPHILSTLGYAQGTFRAPGRDRNFAMYHALSNVCAPTYFAFAFD